MDIVDILTSGGVGLLPTDTIYGLSCSIYDKEAVERIYDIKGRAKHVPVIVLISNMSDLDIFQLDLPLNTSKMLEANWPGKITFVLPIVRGFAHITGGKGKIAFRLPDDKKLISLLEKTGPLVSTSANPTGEKPAINVAEARAYFGEKLDFYEDAGDIYSEPSTLVDLTGVRPVVLRQGAAPFKINN